ncbi:hypothetical protein ACN38_g2122 [Penicillium nordicum]|uniref:Uncharacterized protein n=1 Tax=Penicillium nordicum TaxID=229535 RepID=A0A0M8PAI2_9EURO|nr:hypothetical protein ACN38_g2122 [Penicillium nordicum]
MYSTSHFSVFFFLFPFVSCHALYIYRSLDNLSVMLRYNGLLAYCVTRQSRGRAPGYVCSWASGYSPGHFSSL